MKEFCDNKIIEMTSVGKISNQLSYDMSNGSKNDAVTFCAKKIPLLNIR